MDIDLEARVCALELLTAQLISEYLRTVPDPAAQARWARDQLRRFAEERATQTDNLDERARLRVSIDAHVGGLLEQALARAAAIPLQQPSYPQSPG
jgi:hypothetical protein